MTAGYVALDVEQLRRDIGPTRAMLETLLDDLVGGLPEVVAAPTCPVMGHDEHGNARIVIRPGYDPASRLFLELDDAIQRRAVPPMTSTSSDVKWAAEMFENVLGDFTYESPQDRSVAVLGLISAVQRPTLPLCPAFGVSIELGANAGQGAGKSTLLDLYSIVASGKKMAASRSPATSPRRKRRLCARRCRCGHRGTASSS